MRNKSRQPDISLRQVAEWSFFLNTLLKLSLQNCVANFKTYNLESGIGLFERLIRITDRSQVDRAMQLRNTTDTGSGVCYTDAWFWQAVNILFIIFWDEEYL